MDIREIILNTMGRNGVSQHELARRTGVLQPRVSDYLTGKRDVRAETLTKFLVALHLEITDSKESR